MGMCTRYYLADTATVGEIGKRFLVTKFLFDDLEPRYNIPPGTYNPVISRSSPNRAELMKWGLIPFWSKDPKIGYATMNARSDSLGKPAFREPFKKHRCIVPASGFYEWFHPNPKDKIPYLFRNKDADMFGFAGLYDIWKDVEGVEIITYTIITVDPNDTVRKVHNRMPAILEKAHEQEWLDETKTSQELMQLLNPYPDKLMESYMVSKEVNNPRSDGPHLITKQDLIVGD